MTQIQNFIWFGHYSKYIVLVHYFSFIVIRSIFLSSKLFLKFFKSINNLNPSVVLIEVPFSNKKISKKKYIIMCKKEIIQLLWINFYS